MRNENTQFFYNSQAWRNVRHLYMTSKNYVCERCGGVGEICHHRKYINSSNVNDANITLNFENLECLCQTCHNQEHSAKTSRAIFDDDGNMIGAEDSAEVREFKKAREAIEHMRYHK